MFYQGKAILLHCSRCGKHGVHYGHDWDRRSGRRGKKSANDRDCVKTQICEKIVGREISPNIEKIE